MHQVEQEAIDCPQQIHKLHFLFLLKVFIRTIWNEDTDSDDHIFFRGRARRMDESLHKLNKYCESQVQKKQIRNDILANERPAGPSLLKKGSQVHRNSPDVVNQRLEDRAKNNVLSKRVRTSVAELRVCLNFLNPFTFILAFKIYVSLFIPLSFHTMKISDVRIFVWFSF